MVEIVRDGENGFLVDTEEEAVAAVPAASALDRAGVRASVERRFDVERMVDDYLALYRRVVELHRDARNRERPAADARDRKLSRSGSASTTGRRVPRWAGGRTSIWQRLKPTSRGSPPAVSTLCGCFSPGKTSSRRQTGSTEPMLERLVAVADLAGGFGLELIPTLFTGHMSGVNWIPAWALGRLGR